MVKSLLIGMLLHLVELILTIYDRDLLEIYTNIAVNSHGT